MAQDSRMIRPNGAPVAAEVDTETISVRQQRGGWSARANTTLLFTEGVCFSYTTADNGSALIKDGDGLSLEQVTSGTPGTNCGVQPLERAGRFDCRPFYWCKVAAVDIAGGRYRCGMLDTGNLGEMANADPTVDAACFEYDANRGDTNWQFVTRDGTTVNRTDTGVAFSSGAVLTFEIDIATAAISAVDWEVLDNTRTSLASGSHTTNLPRTTADFSCLSAARNVTTAQKIRTYNGGVINRGAA